MAIEMSVEAAKEFVANIPSDSKLYQQAESFLMAHFASLELEAKQAIAKAERDAVPVSDRIEKAVKDAIDDQDFEHAEKLKTHLKEWKRSERMQRNGYPGYYAPLG